MNNLFIAIERSLKWFGLGCLKLFAAIVIGLMLINIGVFLIQHPVWLIGIIVGMILTVRIVNEVKILNMEDKYKKSNSASSGVTEIHMPSSASTRKPGDPLSDTDINTLRKLIEEA